MDHIPLNFPRSVAKRRSRHRWVLLLVCLMTGELALAWAVQRPRPASSPIAMSPLAGVTTLTLADYKASPITQPVKTAPTAQPVVYELRDGDSLVACQSMFVPLAEHRRDYPASRRIQYFIGYLPAGVHAGSQKSIEVWQGNGELVWAQGNSAYKVDGDLAAFLQTLPARRVVQLLLSSNEQDRENGRRLKRLEGNDFIDALLKLCPSKNLRLRVFALWNLSLLVSETSPLYEFPRWRIKPDPRRAAMVAKAEDVRRVTLQVLKTALAAQRADSKNGQYETLTHSCDCLMETGDQTTADELATLLGDEANAFAWDKLMDTLEAIYGLPPSYEKRGICGNYSKTEMTAFAKQESIRRRAARDKLLQWHADHGGEQRAVQLDAVLGEWHSRLVALGDQRRDHESYEPVPDKRFLPLLRTGRELVSVIEKQQQQSTELVKLGALVFVKACITGKCDAAMVDRLLAADMRQQILACNIIAAARRADWNNQLDKFQYTPLPNDAPTVFYDVLTLRSAASAALLMCDDPQAYLLVKAAYNAGFLNTQANQALKYYTMPTTMR